MKKSTLVLMVVAIAVVAAFGTVTAVSAQGPIQGETLTEGFGGRGGGMRGFGNQGEIQNEEVHALMLDAWAEALGIPSSEIESRLEAGERLSQIALSTGLTFDEFWTLKTQVRTDVTVEALAQGLITQAQADLMQQAALRRAARGGFRGSGFGAGAGSGVYCGAYAPAD